MVLESPSAWCSEDPPSSVATLLVLGQNGDARELDGIDMINLLKDMHMPQDWSRFRPPLKTKRSHCVLSPPPIVHNWTSLFDWLDPRVLATTRDSPDADSIESFDRLSGFLGLIPDTLRDRLNRAGLSCDSDLLKQIAHIIVNSTAEAIKRWQLFKWKQKPE